MFRTIGDQPSDWELCLPAEVLRLPFLICQVMTIQAIIHSP
jgi:hypothetical protein